MTGKQSKEHLHENVFILSASQPGLRASQPARPESQPAQLQLKYSIKWDKDNADHMMYFSDWLSLIQNVRGYQDRTKIMRIEGINC